MLARGCAEWSSGIRSKRFPRFVCGSYPCLEVYGWHSGAVLVILYNGWLLLYCFCALVLLHGEALWKVSWASISN